MTRSEVCKLINHGVLRVRETEPTDTGTVIVVGIPRSGTSMVAAVLKALGVYLGDQIDNAVFEDREFAAALAADDSDLLRRLVAARNEQHAIWGLKRPQAYRHLGQLCQMCRNPRIIVTFRDILAIALRNNIAMQMDALPLLPRLAEEYRDLATTVSQVPAACLLLSYEKALQFPTETVKEIASFCSLRPTDDQLSQAVSVIKNGSPTYVTAARLLYHGSVGRLQDGQLRGWVKAKHRNDIRVSVELLLDGTVTQQRRADVYRPDLQKAGLGDGRYGFEFAIDDHVNRDSVVKVRICHSTVIVENSGRSLSSY